MKRGNKPNTSTCTYLKLKHGRRIEIVNSEIFARILFSRIALKDIFTTLIFATYI